MPPHGITTELAGVKNLGTTERVLRVLLGGALAGWALTRLLAGGAIAGQILDAALLALGADFVVTGIRGYCPLYRRMGWSTVRHGRTH